MKVINNDSDKISFFWGGAWWVGMGGKGQMGRRTSQRLPDKQNKM